MSTWDTAWLIWLGGTVVSFAALEIAAVRSGGWRTSTLTATLRRWLGIQPERPWRLAGIAVILGFCAWLGSHLTFGVLP